MNTKIKLNIFKRKIFSSFTNLILKENRVKIEDGECSDITKILIVRPNHRLGNQLLLLPLVTELQNQFPNVSIDLFLKGNLGNIIFKEHKNVSIIALPSKHFKQLPLYLLGWFKLVFNSYDLVINAVDNSSSGRLATRMVFSKNKIFTNSNYSIIKTNKHIALRPIITLRTSLNNYLITNYNDFPKSDIKLTNYEKEVGYDSVKEIIKNENKIIGLYTVATGLKEYSSDWWDMLYFILKEELPDYEFIEILPDNKRSNIKRGLPQFFSNDIRKLAAFMDNLDLVISADGGIMHLANTTSVTTIGLFKVTNKDVYCPFGKDSFAIDTNAISIDIVVKTIVQALIKNKEVKSLKK